MWRMNLLTRKAMGNRTSRSVVGRWINTKTVETLEECASNGNWKTALSILAELDQTGETNSQAYEFAIEALGRDKKFDAMGMLLETMNNDGVIPTTSTIDMMVQMHMANDNSEKIISLITERLRQNEPLSQPAFQSAIAACASLGEISYPETILNILRKTKNPVTILGPDDFASLIRCFGICRRSDLSMQVLPLMKELNITPTAEVYTQLVRSHISVGAVNQALHAFSLCDQEGIVLGESIHAATIGKLCEKKGFWLATELFATMDAKGVNASPYCLAKMILAYIRTNNIPAARNTWDRIVAQDRPASISTYLGIMNDCVITGEMDILLDVFDEMQKHHTSLPNVAYSFAIRAHGRRGDADSAIALMDTFVEKFGPPNDATPYIAIFNALARSVSDTDAETSKGIIYHYWDMMVNNVYDLQAPAFASAAGAFASNGDIVSLNKLIEHTMTNLPNNEAIMYSGAISGFAKSPVDYSKHIHSFLHQMVNQGIPINDASVRAASDAFIKHEHWNYVKELITIMHPSAFSRPEGVVGDVLSKLLESGHWPLARTTIQAALNWNIQPHIRSKPMVLQKLADNIHEPPEWKIAYSLALETVSFASINEEHVYAVCNALKVLFRAEKHNLVARLWYALKVKNQLPLPIDAYKCIVLSSLASEYDRAALTAGDEMIEMLSKYHDDIVDTSDVSDVISVIISAFQKHHHDPMVIKLFESMEKYHLAPNGYAYLAALRSYGEMNEIDQVKRLLESFEDYMSTTHMDTQDMTNTLCSMISHYAKSRNDEMILKIFELIKQFQLEPNSYAYNGAIRAYSRTNQLNKIMEIQNELSNQSKNINKNVIETILSSYILVNDKNGIEKTILQFKCQPDLILKSYFDINNIQTIVTLMKSQGNYLEKRPFQLTQIMQTNGIKWLISRNAILEAGDVMIYLLKNDYRIQPYLFEDVLDRLSILGAYDLGSILLDEYNKKCSFLNHTSGVIDSMLTMMGNAREYNSIRDTLIESTQLFDIQQYGLGMFLCMDGKEYVNVLKIFEKLRQRFIEPNGQVFSIALDSCLALDDKRVAKLIIQDIIRHRFENKINKELNARLTFALRKDALEIDPSLVERVAIFSLFLEENGFSIPKIFLSKLLNKPTASHLELSTRTRIYTLLRTKDRQENKQRPWWKVDSSSPSV